MDHAEWSLKILELKDSDLMMLISDDHKGLYVQGRSRDELMERLPRAVKDLLEAEGKSLITFSTIDESAGISEPNHVKARLEMASTAGAA